MNVGVVEGVALHGMLGVRGVVSLDESVRLGCGSVAKRRWVGLLISGSQYAGAFFLGGGGVCGDGHGVQCLPVGVLLHCVWVI